MSPQDLAVIESTSWIKSEKLHVGFGKLEHFVMQIAFSGKIVSADLCITVCTTMRIFEENRAVG